MDGMIQAASQTVTVDYATLTIIGLMFFAFGILVSDAVYQLLKWVWLKRKYENEISPDKWEALVKEYRRLKNVENKYMDEIITRMNKEKQEKKTE